MPPPRNALSTPAEISFNRLKSCLVNLPASLDSLLASLNTPAQNVIVELNFRRPTATGSPSGAAPSQGTSVYLGWTGMPSKRRATPLVGRDGINSLRGGRDKDLPLVEMDDILARTLGLTEGHKVLVTVHVDPPLVHTINIEPLTPEDWEVIELHANFLELNMQSQIRAIPNPAFSPSSGAAAPSHPLTVHLSPVTTANVKIISIDPPLEPGQAFAKVSPDAEVIVAPKTRSKASNGKGDNRSVASTSKSRKSKASAGKKGKEEPSPALYLRGMDRAACKDWFDDEPATDLSVWADQDALAAGGFGGMDYVVVHVMKPAGLHKPQAEEQSGPKAADKIVARLRFWDDAPNSQAIALSTPLCAALGFRDAIGGIVKIQPTPAPVQRGSVKSLMVYPFVSDDKDDEGLRFGGQSKAEKEEAAKRFKTMYADKGGLLGGGPITDCTIFPKLDGLHGSQGWEGGLVKFDPESAKDDPLKWAHTLDGKISIQFQAPIPRPAAQKSDDPWDLAPASDTALAGVDALANNLFKQLRHMSSTMLTGAMGSGKTSLVKNLAQRLRRDLLFHTVYLPCRGLINEENRTATVKETVTRAFMSASWGARLGGRAIVILDDLDKLCPAETELVVGNDNERSRLLSETVVSIARQYCDRASGVVLLATAAGKDSLHKVLVGGHLVREIVEMRAPDKEARRQVLQSIVNQALAPAEPYDDGASDDGSRPPTADGPSDRDGGGEWMDGGSPPPRRRTTRRNAGGFTLDPDLDMLEVAGLTDGYMPADLFMLVSRARNEAIFRVINGGELERRAGSSRLGKEDFDKALKGFTPASLRNVPLQKSTTTFASIGGLRETRQVLLETLQYPTKYAPLFAKCPLRLRSGLLLYGYPGCGKTLLASAVAGECGLNFISVKGPEILNKYIGASEKSVRDLFERASAAKPCVLFFDEFDSIAPKRGHDSTGVTDRVVNQLLTQMDGAEGLSGVYVLAATSRPDLIDPALLRPGRLDKSLLCDLPTIEDRLDIIKAMSRKVRLEDELTESDDAFAELARRTEGFSGADLQALVSNAQLEAIHDLLQGQDFTPRAGEGGKNGGKAVGTPSFVQFRYGGDESNSAAPTRGSKAAELAENARILSKLEGIRQAKKKSKLMQKTRSSTTTNGGTGEGKDENQGKATARENKEAVLGWAHFEAALEGMRASISADERRRLERIYREFVGQRSGEMRDGQGSFEVGGRSSLM